MKIAQLIVDAYNASKVFIRKNKSEILHYAGTAAIVGGAAWGCYASTKLDNVLEDCEDTIHLAKEDAEDLGLDEKEKGKLMLKAYTYNVGQFLKLYSGPVITFATGIAMNESAHWQQKAQIGSLTAACVGYEAFINRYRNNVKTFLGEEVDKQMVDGTQTGTIESKYVDEKGKNKVKKEKGEVASEEIDAYTMSAEYDRVFAHERYCVEHGMPFNQYYKNEDMEYLLSMIETMRKQMFSIMVSRYSSTFHTPGYLFLNEVYDSLGFPRTKAGQVVGWLYDPENPSFNDNTVDFGVHTYWDNDPDLGTVPVVRLHFNVAGVIINEVGLSNK